FFFQAGDGIRDMLVTGVQTCALPISVKEILELEPVRLVFHYLQNNQVQVTTRDAKQLDEAQKVVQEAAADIRAGEFPAKRGFVRSEERRVGKEGRLAVRYDE